MTTVYINPITEVGFKHQTLKVKTGSSSIVPEWRALASLTRLDNQKVYSWELLRWSGKKRLVFREMRHSMS